MKQCSDCNQIKPYSDFNKKSSGKDGYEIRCKKCRNIKYKKGSLEAVVRKIYLTQLSNSVKRGHVPPNYTLEELTNWVSKQPHWSNLYQNWKDSDYKRKLAPSVDRLDNSLPYSLSNIQLTSWEDNLNNANRDTKDNILQRNQRPVRALNKDGTVHKEYASIANALEDVDGHYWGISTVANGVKVKKSDGYSYTPRSYKGFKWEWV